MFQTKGAEKIKTHFMFSNFFFFGENCSTSAMWKNVVERCHRWQYGTCAFHDGYLRLQMHTWNM